MAIFTLRTCRDRLAQAISSGRLDCKPMHIAKSLLWLGTLIGTTVLLTQANMPACANPRPRWQKYVLIGGRCSVLLPGKPNEIAQDDPNGQFTTHMRISQYIVPGHGYSVIYMYFTPAQSKQESITKRFAEFKSGLLGRNKKLIKEADLTLQGYPGKEYRLQRVDKPITIICRCYLVGNAMYHLIYQFASTGPPITTDAPEAVKFLNSFTLLPVSEH
jgi:hypothetical protein